MKNVKRISSLLLALVLVLSLATTAFAAEVTIQDMEGHSFKAYQIFTGTQSESEGMLGNVAWGDGIDPVGFLAALQAETTAFKVTVTEGETTTEIANVFADCVTAADVAAAMANFSSNSDAAKLIANLADANKTGEGTALTEGKTDLEDGYYLIVDVTDLGTDSSDANNPSLLQVTRDVTINVKYTVPSVEKKVQDKDDSAGSTTGWQDSADFDVNDEISYMLTGTLPSNYSDYETYKYVFHDTMSGVTYVDKSAVVTIDGVDVTEKFTVTYENGKLTVSCENLKAISGVTKDSKVVVTYTATLNADAVVGAAGNANTVYVEYSNNPNADGEGHTGKTPEDKVTVFTFQVIVNKVDEYNNPLKGAEFTLYKKDDKGTWNVFQTLSGDDMTTFTFTGLDAGVYKLSETSTPAGYNTAADIEFTITATHDETSDDPQLTELTCDLESFVADVTTGSLTTSVVNLSGTTLPETGGVGTTIFYIVGGILVLAAVVLLVTKRRMNAEM